MKVYIIYACIPENLWTTKMRSIDDDIKESELPKQLKTADNRYVGVYAYTRYKDVLDEFIEYRKGAWKSGLYELKKAKMSKEEFSMFRATYPTRELVVFPVHLKGANLIGHNTDKYKSFDETPKWVFEYSANQDPTMSIIICTPHEYNYVEDMSDHCLFMLFVNLNPPDYSIFDDDYQNILDIIGYTIQYTDLINTMMEDEVDNLYINQRFDEIDYNYSFNLSPLGNKYFSLSHSFSFMFMNIFYEMIFGYDENTKINMIGVI